MESPCHHAGCMTQAVWVSLCKSANGPEPYLCDLHWSVLSLRDAERAGWYVPMSPDALRFRRADVQPPA